MEKYTFLLQAISTVGFPIVCCAALFWMIQRMSEQHKQESDAMRGTLDRNTNVLTELKDLIAYRLGGNDDEKR